LKLFVPRLSLSGAGPSAGSIPATQPAKTVLPPLAAGLPSTQRVAPLAGSSRPKPAGFAGGLFGPDGPIKPDSFFYTPTEQDAVSPVALSGPVDGSGASPVRGTPSYNPSLPTVSPAKGSPAKDPDALFVLRISSVRSWTCKTLQGMQVQVQGLA
jgi:hypothetical protein